MKHILDFHPLGDLYGPLEAAAGIGMWHYSFSTQRHAWSHGMYKLLGLDAETSQLKPGYDLFVSNMHPDDRLPTDNFDMYLRQVGLIDRRFRILAADGGIRWMSQHSEVLLDFHQEPSFAIGIVTEITPNMEAEKARDKSEARLRMFTRASHCFTWIVRPDGFKPPSQGWTELTGQSSEEASGMGWLDCVDPADRERVKRIFRHSWDTVTPYAAKYRLRCRDGITRWFLARCAPVYDKAGTIREWFGVGMDVSDVNTAVDSFSASLDSDDPTGPLIKAARALLDWSIEDLAAHSGVSISSIRRIESDLTAVVRNRTAERILQRLTDAGIEFYHADDFGTFIRLHRA